MHRAFGEALGFAGRAPKMADNDDPVRINHHWLPPSVRFDRGAHFGDGMGGPLACVSRVVFRAVNGPHLDVHGFRVRPPPAEALYGTERRARLVHCEPPQPTKSTGYASLRFSFSLHC